MNLARHWGKFSWALAAKLLPFIYGVAIIFIVIPILPPAEFGRFSLVFNTFNLIAVLNRSLVLQPMMRCAADPAQFGRMTRAGLKLTLLFLAGCVVIVLIAAAPVAKMFRLTTKELELTAVLTGAFVLREYGFFYQQTLYRTGKIFVIEVVYFVGTALAFGIAAKSGKLHTGSDAIAMVAVAAAASSLTALLLGSVPLKGLFQRESEAIKAVFHYGVKTLPTGIAGALFASADVLILGIIYTPVEVAVYNGAKAVYRVTSAATQAVGLLVTPYAARLMAEKNDEGIRELFEKSIAYVFVGLVIAVGIGWFLAGFFYQQFLGDSYSGSAPLFRILLIAAPFEGLFNVAGGLLYGIGAAGLVSLVSVGALGVMLVLSAPMIYLFSSSGCALALVIALAFGGVWMSILAGRRFQTTFKATFGKLRNIFHLLGRLRRGAQ